MNKAHGNANICMCTKILNIFENNLLKWSKKCFAIISPLILGANRAKTRSYIDEDGVFIDVETIVIQKKKEKHLFIRIRMVQFKIFLISYLKKKILKFD